MPSEPDQSPSEPDQSPVFAAMVRPPPTRLVSDASPSNMINFLAHDLAKSMGIQPATTATPPRTLVFATSMCAATGARLNRWIAGVSHPDPMFTWRNALTHPVCTFNQSPLIPTQRPTMVVTTLDLDARDATRVVLFLTARGNLYITGSSTMLGIDVVRVIMLLTRAWGKSPYEGNEFTAILPIQPHRPLSMHPLMWQVVRQRQRETQLRRHAGDQAGGGDGAADVLRREGVGGGGDVVGQQPRGAVVEQDERGDGKDAAPRHDGEGRVGRV
jgi:hypothetical protein